MQKRNVKIGFLCLVAGVLFVIGILYSHRVSIETPPPGPMLMHKGRSVQSWVAQIWAPSRKQNPEIMRVAEIGQPAVPFLIQRLRDPSTILTRSDSYKWMWSHLPRGVQSQEMLPRPASHRNERERTIAAVAYTLGRIGAEAKEAILPLSRIAETRKLKHFPRRFAIQALARIGGDYTTAAPSLRLLLKSSNHSARAAAAVALWRMEEKEADQSRVLSFLQPTDTKLSSSTIVYLGNIGLPTLTFLPTLRSLEFESESLKSDTERAIKKIESAVPTKESRGRSSKERLIAP